MPQTSTVLNKYLFPAGDIKNDVKVWGDVADELADFTKTWQESIGDGVGVVQNNISAFIPL